MKTKTKLLAIVQIAVVLCSLFLVALPTIAAEQQSQAMQKVSASTITTLSEDDYVLGIYGNANEDDTIDMGDVVYIKLAIFGKKPKTELCDAKYDGRINVLDVIQTKLIIRGNEKELTFIDSVDRIVTVKKTIERIIALDHYGCEMVRAVGAKNKVMGGMLRDPEYWPELADKPVVGGFRTPDYEKIVDLEPDVVITCDLGDPNTEKKLEPCGITVVRLDFYKPKTFVRDVRLLGIMLDEEEGASELIDFFQGHLNTVQERIGTLNAEEKKRVYYEGGDYSSVAEGSGWHEMVELGGGINIFAGAGASTFKVDPEEILDRNPQLVWRSGPGRYIPPDPSEMEALWNALISRPGWADLDAMKNDQVHIMTYWNAKGCAKLVAICYLANWLYPDMFQDLDPEAVAKEWYEGFQEVEYKGGYVYPLED